MLPAHKQIHDGNEGKNGGRGDGGGLVCGGGGNARACRLWLTEGGVNYGLWSLKNPKGAEVAAFNRGTLSFDLNFGLL